MALRALRLQRTLSTLSSSHRFLSSAPVILPNIKISAATKPVSSLLQSSTVIPQSLISSSWSRWVQAALYSSKQYKLYKEGDEITPDTVLFEGCDYNHWLITMDFPKDNPPSHEEMIATYEQTCAKGLNISLEEAKKRMYACSTTTYQGFQAIMTEEESEKFRDVPGVVFILPDSYIDPVNKEYGGDKYENGVITPRPPPIQYSSRGRIRDRNRNPDQSRYDRQGTSMSNRQGTSMSNRQGNSPYNQQVPMQGDGKNYGPPQNYSPQQNYGIPGQGERRDHMPMSNRDYAPGGRDTYQTDRRGPMPSNQGHYNPGGQGSYNPGGQGNYSQEQMNFPPRDQVNYSPPSQGDFRVGNRNYAPTHGGSYEGATNPSYGQSYTGHGEGQGFPPVDERNVQGEPRNHVPLGQRDQMVGTGEQAANLGVYDSKLCLVL